MSRHFAITATVLVIIVGMGHSNTASAQWLRRLFDPCNACGPPACCCSAPVCPAPVYPVCPCATPQYTTQIQPISIQTGFAQPGCNSCGETAWNPPAPSFGTAYRPYSAQPQFASQHTKWQTPPAAPAYRPHLGPTPDPNFAASAYREAPAPEPWTRISSRHRDDRDSDPFAQDGWQDDSYDRRPYDDDYSWRHDDDDRRPHRARGPYITAPSAALVWQSNRDSRRW